MKNEGSRFLILPGCWVSPVQEKWGRMRLTIYGSVTVPIAPGKKVHPHADHSLVSMCLLQPGASTSCMYHSRSADFIPTHLLSC